MEKNQFEALRELTERRDYRALRTALAEENEVDIAEFIEALPEEKATVAFRTLPKELAAEVFSNLPPETQQVIIMSVTDRELSAIVEDLFVDDAVDMLEELPANVVRRVLKNAHPDTRKLINQFLNYPENSVGSIMTAEFMDLKKSMTVEAAIKHIRRTGEESESIYTCYVTDASRRLEVDFPSIFRAIRSTFRREVFSTSSCSWGKGRFTSSFASSICAVRFSSLPLFCSRFSAMAARALSRRAMLPTGSLPSSMVWDRFCFIVTWNFCVAVSAHRVMGKPRYSPSSTRCETSVIFVQASMMA